MNPLKACLGTLILAAVFYSPLRHAPFVYDDMWYIVHNPGIRQLQPLKIFADPSLAAAPESGLAGDAYRPGITLTLAAAYQLWRLAPMPYHLLNLLLHLINAYLVWLFLGRVLKMTASRLLGLAVFLWHPVQVQAVAWVSQISTLLSSLGMLIALLCLDQIKKGEVLRLVAGWAAFAAALFCREITGGIILILAMLDTLRGGLPKQKREHNWFYLRYAGLVTLTALYILVRSHLLPSWSELSGPRNLSSDMALGLMAFSTYIGKLIWPMHLRLHYAYPFPRTELILGALLTALAYSAAILVAVRRAPRYAVALIWIAVFLIPVLQIIPIRAFAAERYLYFSVIGFAWMSAQIYERYPLSRSALWMGVACLAGIAWLTIPSWRSEEALWGRNIQADPQDAFAQVSYATCVKDPTLAESHYRQAMLSNPSESIAESALISLTGLALDQKNYRKAEIWARQALKRAPGDRLAQLNYKRVSRLGEGE